MTGLREKSRRIRSARASGNRLQPFDELALGHRPDLGGDRLPVLEQDEGGDAAHAVFLRRLGILVDIDLGDGKLVLHLAGDLVEDGTDLLAGAAPFRPEIDQHGAARLEHVLIEIGIVDMYSHKYLTSILQM